MRPDAVRIDLTDEEMIAASTFGRMRQIVNRSTTNTRRSGADDAAVHVVGVMGELAFSRWANLAFDFSIGARSGGADFQDSVGGVDVKTRYGKSTSLDLLVMPKPNPTIDAYVLAIKDGSAIWLVRWELASVVRREKNLSMQTGQENYLVVQSALRSMDTYVRTRNPAADQAIDQQAQVSPVSESGRPLHAQ